MQIIKNIELKLFNFEFYDIFIRGKLNSSLEVNW